MRTWMLSLSVGTLLLGCGSSDGRCDTRTLLGTKGYCYETSQATVPSGQFAQNLCRTIGATWESGRGCEHANAVGGCQVKLDLGGTATRWYFSDGQYTSSAALANSNECSDGTAIDVNGKALPKSNTPPSMGDRPDAGAIGVGICEPAQVPAGTCTFGLNSAYDCTHSTDGLAPEPGCAYASTTVVCCPDPLCQASPRQDSSCTGATPHAYMCWGSYTPKAGCTRLLDGAITGYCCP